MSPKQRIAYTTAVECLQCKPNLISNILEPRSTHSLRRCNRRPQLLISLHTFLRKHSALLLSYHPLQPLTTITPKPRASSSTSAALHLPLRPTPPQRMQLHRPPALLDWTLTYADPLASKIFSSTPDSISSNGITIPNRNGTFTTAFGRPRTIPAATGGGCVTSGPFLNNTLNLGPASYEPRVGSSNGLDYSPR